ncbi:hypothetical protein AAFF_G00178010 [Aldrovandia affinis]|uniref:Secreted protein n=1 Tax=Aldrovandia affinis TaxID=143900 RepID=A0AAD7W786_9TELE|nr:hypothetical protein AAFF_G00178010 [Aldrovandia affinis]
MAGRCAAHCYTADVRQHAAFPLLLLLLVRDLHNASRTDTLPCAPCPSTGDQRTVSRVTARLPTAASALRGAAPDRELNSVSTQFSSAQDLGGRGREWTG